jgi:hypothetical protein
MLSFFKTADSKGSFMASAAESGRVQFVVFVAAESARVTPLEVRIVPSAFLRRIVT